MKYKNYKLEDICEYVKERIQIEKVTLENYMSTENLLPEKGGKQIASSLPKAKTVVSYQKGDTLISNIRPYFKKIWFSNTVGGSSGDVLVFRANKKINEIYLYYFLSQNEIFDYMVQTSKGTKMPRGDKEALMKYHIRLPVLEYQKKVSDMLSNIDNKIELNNFIISNLEELAQMLFKRWFVDFEFPNENGQAYKSSGGKMVESELGMILEGWEVKVLKDLIDVIDNRGKTPPQEPYPTPFPIIDVKGLSGEGRIVNYKNCMKFVNKETYDNWFRSGHPNELDVLFSTVGSLASIKMFFGSKGCIAQNVVALRATTINPYFLYQYVKNEQEEIKTLDIGSVQPSIKVTYLIKKKILSPSEEIYVKCNKLSERVTKKIYGLELEIERLSELRDTLLPKLLSGEIEISDKTEVTDDVPVS